MDNVFITGDKHGDFNKLCSLIRRINTNKEDTIIILGDVGINYYVKKLPMEQIKDSGPRFKNSKTTKKIKSMLSELSITFFCIHGNHEARPESINSYKTKIWNDGVVYYEEEYPHILFAKDGEIYNINGKKCLVAGGAYSIDKYWRLQQYNNGRKDCLWFNDEQMSEATKEKIMRTIDSDIDIDVILSHTCPLRFEPTEVFLSGINQNNVDKSTEIFLDKIYEKIGDKIQQWYCGHYHINKKDKNVSFMFDEMELL